MVNEANMGLPNARVTTHSVVKHAQRTSVRELIQKIEKHPDRHALQQDLRQNQAYNPFGPESKKLIQEVGNIELFELLETEPQNAVHSMPIILERRHRLLHMRPFLAERNRGQSKIRYYTMDLPFTPGVRLQEGKTSWPQIWKKARRQRILSGQPVSEWLNIIEMKKFVDNGMFLKMKITLITCQKKNTSTTRTNGGFVPISRVLTPYYWEIVLISSKRCLPWNDYTKKLEKNHTCPLILTSTNNGSWHRVRLPHGGIGKIPCGLLNIQKVKEEASKVLRMNGRPVIVSTLAKTSEDGCQELTITEHSLTTTSAQSDYNIQKERTLHLVLRMRSDRTHDTNDNVTTKTQSTFHTAHMNLNTWIDARVIPCAHSPVVRFQSSWSAHHIAWLEVQVVRVSHVIHACSERHSSTLSSPFHSVSSSSHSPSISCSPFCSSSTTLRTVVTLRTPPKRRWSLLMSPTSPHISTDSAGFSSRCMICQFKQNSPDISPCNFDWLFRYKSSLFHLSKMVVHSSGRVRPCFMAPLRWSFALLCISCRVWCPCFIPLEWRRTFHCGWHNLMIFIQIL